MSNEAQIEKLRTRWRALNNTSPSFCLAKWLQTTVNLQNGFTHSCHHPPAHKIPLSEIQRSPSALHNTEHKKREREQMINGSRPSGCSYCWTIEDLPGDHISDRAYKSTAQWAWPFLVDVLEAGSVDDIDPTYFEVSFDNTCNLKCAYCSPDISSKWMEEIKQHGPYPTSNRHNSLEHLERQDRMPILNRDANPYVDAFWEWWPTLYQSLRVFRITGGEPLLSKHTWKILKYVEENPITDFRLSVNTNMMVADDMLEKFAIQSWELSRVISEMSVFTSAEAYGRQCEYIRYGMKYETFIQNVDYFLRETYGDVPMHMMVAFNALSITSFHAFLDDILMLRRKHNTSNDRNLLGMMINYVRWPRFMDVRILPDEIKHQYGDQIVAKMKANIAGSKPGGFYLEEIDQAERLVEYMFTPVENPEVAKRDFGLYFQEYDRRRGTNFHAVFPQLVPFYEECLSYA